MVAGGDDPQNGWTDENAGDDFSDDCRSTDSFRKESSTARHKDDGCEAEKDGVQLHVASSGQEHRIHSMSYN